MVLSLKHSAQTVVADDGTSPVGADEWNADHATSMATASILGRVTAGTGAIEELSAASVRTLINVANGATANSTDATLLARANHTGTQLAATISDFSTSADARISAAVGVSVQAYSSALASWAGVARASGFDTFAATPSSANLAALVTNETGSGLLVFATSPTLTTPTINNATIVTSAMGTPTAIVLTNGTGLPVSTGLSGLATNMATWLAGGTSAQLAATMTDETGSGALVFGTSPTIATATLNSPTLVTPAIGTPTAGLLTNCTGLPVSTGISGLGTGVAAFLATPSSANLAAAITDEVGSSSLAFQSQGSTTPTVTATSGTFTSVSCALTWERTGNVVTWRAAVTITTNGTAAGGIVIPLPVANSAAAAPVQGVDANSVLALTGVVGASASSASIYLYNGTYAGGTGKLLVVGGQYRA